MKIISRLSEIDFLDALVGTWITQVIVDPYELRFILDSGDEIDVESKINYRSDDNEKTLDIQEKTKTAFDFYSIMEKKIMKSFASGPSSWKIEFENSVSMELVASDELAESIHGIFRQKGTFAFIL